MVRKIVNNRQRALQQANWLPLRQAHRSVCHKHIDLFYPYVLQRNNQGPSLPKALAGITISLTVSQFAHLPSISIPHALPSVSSALRKRKTNSFPYKWSESLQPRDPVELQIFHLRLGASLYYSLAIILSLSFVLFFYFLSLFFALIPTHGCYPPMLMLTSIRHLAFQIAHLTEKKHHPTILTALQPFTTPSV